MIKNRVVQLIEFKEIAKEDFYKKIGITSANFRGKAKETPLNSTTIANIISIIPDVNLEWLITGKGEMIKTNAIQSAVVGDEIQFKYISLLEENNRLLKENAALKERLLKLGESPKAAATARRHSA